MMHPTPLACLAAAACLLAGCASAPAARAPGAAATPAAAVAARLVDQVDIPFETFTLANGLRVVVHEDRKAPVVAVSVWYNVGSKDEPPGKTGFAHLFEHLMYNGSENAPGDFFEPLREIGATDYNGSTWFDRTNYFQTVPTPALERVLFLESDRMGYLLGAVTEANLKNQIAVVQNEKRQGDNQPYGLVEYKQLAALFPEGHPYRHSTIGSMADLASASLADVRQWFRDKYGPNNAVLVLAGDVDAAEARPLVERYFGTIPRGPANRPADAPVPTLPAPLTEVLKDRVATTRLYRNWTAPGLTDPELIPLDVGATVLGGLASSRLDNLLVRKEQSAVRVSAAVLPFQRVSLVEVQVDVKPGVDAQAVSKRLDEIVADFIAAGPTEDEVRRVVMRELSGRIQGLEQVGGEGGKAVALAEGALYADDPEFYKKQLLAYGRVTPAQVRAALRKWLTRPAYALTVEPGERERYDEAAAPQGSAPSQRPRFYRAGAQAASAPAAGAVPGPAGAKRPLPPVGEIANIDFPQIERARLSNGIPVTYVRRRTVPVVRVAVEFDAGIAADPADRLGTQSLMLDLLEEGTTSLDSIALAEAQERLGTSISAGASLDRTAVQLSALTPNLGPSLDLLADVVRNPAFAPGEVERLRAQQLAEIASELADPGALALRALPRLLYGPAHPYGKPFTGSGDPDSLRSITRDDLVAFHQRWIRPDKAHIFAVGDLPLEELVPQLEARFGDWTAPPVAAAVKDFSAPPPAARPRIVLIDRPQSPQSVIYAGAVLPVTGTQDLLAMQAANEVLGGNFLARINMDLRETKGWSYGTRTSLSLFEHQVPFLINAPVQADKTGPAVAAILDHLRAITGASGVTEAELARVVNGNTRQLAGSFETSGALLGAIRSLTLRRRPDDYYENLAGRYRAFSRAALDQAAQRMIDPDRIVWVVVGDAATVRPQLEALGLPVETAQPR